MAPQQRWAILLRWNSIAFALSILDKLDSEMNLDSIIKSDTNTFAVNPLATNSATTENQLKTMNNVRKIGHSVLKVVRWWFPFDKVAHSKL